MTNRPGPVGAELPYLEIFRVVCDEGGMTAAARRLGCSQPAVSYQIRKLEQTIGVRLLERSGRRLVLTAEGKRFRDLADRVLGELARVRRECLELGRLEPLRLGSASGFGRYVLMPALHRLQQEMGADTPLEVRLQYDAADVVLNRLEGGDYEAAFVFKRKVSSGLEYEAVYQEELVLVGAPGLIRKVTERDRLRSFETLPFITYEECDYVFGHWFETCFGAQPARLTSRSHFTELEEVIDFARRGIGASILPRDSAEASIERGELEVLRAGRGERCLNQVYRVVRAGSEPRPSLEQLTEILRAWGSAPAIDAGRTRGNR
jgi:LysR family transcriptional regulator, cyn operon transcriptional activator